MSRPVEIDREQILIHAVTLLGNEGYETFSMRKLAIRCNVAVSTIYLHFENKMDIMIEVVSKFWKECFTTFNAQESTNFFDSIRTLYYHILSHLEHFKVKWLNSFTTMNIMDKSQGKEAMNQFISLIHKKIISQLELYQSTFDKNYFDKCDKEYLAKFIYDNFTGLLMKFSHDYEKFETILKRILLG